MEEAQRRDRTVPNKWLLAILCLCAGVAPLAARWIPNDVIKIAYGVLITAVFLALTLLARTVAELRVFWDLLLAFLIFALVQLLNNCVPFFGAHVLHETPVPGNPLAATVGGTVVIQLLETVIAIVPILVLTRACGRPLGSVYARVGHPGRWFILPMLSFVVFSLLIVSPRASRFLPRNGPVTPSHLLALTPALLVLVVSNGFQEEFLFRGLFLQRYDTFFGARIANVLQAIIFAIAHAGVTYTPSALLFIVLIVFPLGLLCGFLMQRTNGAVTPALFHAGADIPIYFAFLTFMS